MNVAPVNQKTIPIVDDTPDNIDILKEILKGEFIVKAATKGSKALDLARTTEVDLVLLDVMMPEMDGYEVCRALKEGEATKSIPVIFVSALNEPLDEAKGFESGGVDYLTKPVSAPVVLARVRTHLALTEARDQLHEWNVNLKSQALMTLEEQSGKMRGYIHIVELLSGIFELMGGRFGVHSRTVGELAGDAARKMGLDAETVAKIRLARLLHDVGKIGLPESTLKKGGEEVSAVEQREQRLHPARGQELFMPIEELHDVGLMVRGHHEAYNGNGYPDGLKGEDIPVGARLVAIADFIEQAACSVTGQRTEYAFMKARLHADTLLDGHLIPHFSGIAKTIYFEGKNVAMEANVGPAELITGLVISRDIVSTSGVLLLQRESTLDATGVALIRRQHGMGLLPEDDVWVSVNEELNGGTLRQRPREPTEDQPAATGAGTPASLNSTYFTTVYEPVRTWCGRTAGVIPPPIGDGVKMSPDFSTSVLSAGG